MFLKKFLKRFQEFSWKKVLKSFHPFAYKSQENQASERMEISTYITDKNKKTFFILFRECLNKQVLNVSIILSLNFFGYL